MLHDAVHLTRNVRNNLLNYKRFIFPAFECDGFNPIQDFPTVFPCNFYKLRNWPPNLSDF